MKPRSVAKVNLRSDNFWKLERETVVRRSLIELIRDASLNVPRDWDLGEGILVLLSPLSRSVGGILRPLVTAYFLFISHLPDFWFAKIPVRTV